MRFKNLWGEKTVKGNKSTQGSTGGGTTCDDEWTIGFVFLEEDQGARGRV